MSELREVWVVSYHTPMGATYKSPQVFETAEDAASFIEERNYEARVARRPIRWSSDD